MTPEHHEERLCAWAEKTGRPVLSLNYGKAPECECIGFTSRQRCRLRVGSSVGVLVSGMWEHNGKLCSPCETNVLLWLTEQFLIGR